MMLILLSLLSSHAFAEEPALRVTEELTPFTPGVELVPDRQVQRAFLAVRIPASLAFSSAIGVGSLVWGRKVYETNILGGLVMAGGGLVMAVGAGEAFVISVPVSGVMSAMLARSLTEAGAPTRSFAGWSGAAISLGTAVYAHAHIGELREDPAYRVVVGSGVAVGWGLSMVQMLQNRRSLVRVGQPLPFPEKRTTMLQLQPLLTPSAVGLQLRW
jgi:hypothetical protein